MCVDATTNRRNECTVTVIPTDSKTRTLLAYELAPSVYKVYFSKSIS